MNKQHQRRPYPVCGTEFTAKSTKKQFCSDTCRANNHARKTTQNKHQQAQIVTQQAQEIQQLTQTPVTRTEVVKEVNLEWLFRKQAYVGQQNYQNEIKARLIQNSRSRHHLTTHSQGAVWGAGTGFSLVLLWMSFRYEARQRKPLGLVFVVTSLILLIGVSFIGKRVGSQIERSLIGSDESNQLGLKALDEEDQLLTESLNEISKQIEGLRRLMNAVPQYDRETVIQVNEARNMTVDLQVHSALDLLHLTGGIF